jgi:hypothetical protein
MQSTCQCHDWIAKGWRRYGKAAFQGTSLALMHSSRTSNLATMLSTRPTRLTNISQNKSVGDGDGILDDGYAYDLETTPDKLIKACLKPVKPAWFVDSNSRSIWGRVTDDQCNPLCCRDPIAMMPPRQKNCWYNNDPGQQRSLLRIPWGWACYFDPCWCRKPAIWRSWPGSDNRR